MNFTTAPQHSGVASRYLSRRHVAHCFASKWAASVSNMLLHVTHTQ
jgi:hypothetical protein